MEVIMSQAPKRKPQSKKPDKKPGKKQDRFPINIHMILLAVIVLIFQALLLASIAGTAGGPTTPALP